MSINNDGTGSQEHLMVITAFNSNWRRGGNKNFCKFKQHFVVIDSSVNSNSKTDIETETIQL